MNRVQGIVRVIKNLYYLSVYYDNTNNKKQTGSDVINNIDSSIYSKLNNANLVKGMYDGLIEFINSMILPMYAEFTQEQVEEFKFVCCAYIDEIMYHNIGENIWSTYLLEHHFFNTRISGEKMMYKIVKFLSQHSQQDSEYALVYYYMLCTGYLGMYKQDVLKLKALKKELIKIIKQEVLFNTDTDSLVIAPNIYSMVIKTKQIERIKNYRRIYIQAVLCSLCLLILVISAVIYKGQIILKILLC